MAPDSPGGTSRFAAIEILCHLKKSRKPVTELIDHGADSYNLSRKDRQLAVNLIYGVLRNYSYLDQLLAILCRKPVKKIHPFVHQALRVGLFQLFFLDRIPVSAAINETVNSLKTYRLPGKLVGFTNGVLRAADRQRHDLPAPAQLYASDNPPLNHPHWLCNRWQKHYGKEEMQRICCSNNRQPLLVLRVNSTAVSKEQLTEKLTDLEIEVRDGEYAPDALVISDFHGQVASLPGYSEGWFQVQDQGAQLISLLLAPLKKKGYYLDACAGLGGKTTHIAAMLAQSGSILTAVEPSPYRQRKLLENLARVVPELNVNLHKGNLQDFSRISRSGFDGILVDAPCSGTGVIGRNPDIRWNRQEKDLPDYHRTQLEILSQAAALCAANGTIVYATCSLEPIENQEVVKKFLTLHPDFSLSDCREVLPDTAKKLTSNNFFCPRPDIGIDGFFAARLVRTH